MRVLATTDADGPLLGDLIHELLCSYSCPMMVPFNLAMKGDLVWIR